MMANQRKDKIPEVLREDGSAEVIELSEIFKVSEVTIRHDLEKPEKDGLVKREHGGAFLKEVEQQVRTFPLMNQTNLEKKSSIGKTAATLIGDDDFQDHDIELIISKP